MDFFFETHIHHPVEMVYRAYRDELATVARAVENVERIDLVADARIPGGREIHNLWNGRGIIPRVARRLIFPHMLVMDSWTVWHDAERSSDWVVTPRHYSHCGHCHGELRFLPAGPNRTRVTMSGELGIRLDSISIVPRLLRAWVEEQVERFFLSLGEPNHRGVGQLFDEHLGHPARTVPAEVAAAAGLEELRQQRVG